MGHIKVKATPEAYALMRSGRWAMPDDPGYTKSKEQYILPQPDGAEVDMYDWKDEPGLNIQYHDQGGDFNCAKVIAWAKAQRLEIVACSPARVGEPSDDYDMGYSAGHNYATYQWQLRIGIAILILMAGWMAWEAMKLL